ncbi:hypothetical protein R1sor_021529 [Riccia sorocarpa]|uniref:Uncharacterized protein n=1 Tax=Riccia sorocarpa TaxID=122646 RepID=A0ABD3GHC4_9MARC
MLIGGERTRDEKEGLKICISQFQGLAALRRAARPAAPRKALRLYAGPSRAVRLFARLCAEPRDSAALRKAAEHMTFTRKTGRARPVENEATVDVEVTRPKRNMKKPVAAADLSSTSQRVGKKRVHEGSAGSPPKRKKSAVQPLPKLAIPKARSKVKAPKRVRKERAESVEAVADEGVVVEKERSSKGPWLIKRYYKVDVISNVQWAYMKPEDISGAFAGISEFHQRRLGLRGVITRQYVPPNEELNPPASQQPFPKHVMRIGLEDWFSRYDEKAKRYLAEDCVHEVWRPVFQCLQSFLLAKCMPRSIAGPIIHFVKSALQPIILEDEEDGEEDTSMGPHPKLLDLAAYQFKCVRDEMCQVKMHFEKPNNSRLRETFVGQVLTHLLIHLGIYNPSPEEDLNDDTQVILHEDVGSSKRRVAAPNRAAEVTRHCASRAHCRGPERGRKSHSRPCTWATSPNGRAQGLATPRRAVEARGGPALGSQAPQAEPCAGLRPSAGPAQRRAVRVFGGPAQGRDCPAWSCTGPEFFCGST